MGVADNVRCPYSSIVAMLINQSRRAALRVCRPVRAAHAPARKLHSISKEMLPSADSMPVSAKEWDFHLLETGDLPNACDLMLLSLASNSEEHELGEMRSIINGAFVKLGLRFRSRQRLAKPSMALTADSVILAATVRGTTEIAALVEIHLLKPDGGFVPMFGNPFRSSTAVATDQPYLYNLCVANAHRKKGLGRLICEVAQELVLIHWKKEFMSLHVHKSNVAANALYKAMGYHETAMNETLPDTGENTPLYYRVALKRSWTTDINRQKDA